jgi:Fe-S-cluster-containing hydrogenase component 2
VARAVASAGLERPEQKPVSLHVTLVMRARSPSKGWCYRTAAPKAITPSATVAPSMASKSASIFLRFFTGPILRNRRGLRNYNEQHAKYFACCINGAHDPQFTAEQCDHPPAPLTISAPPLSSASRDSDTGVILVGTFMCRGCGSCAGVCADARSVTINHRRSVELCALIAPPTGEDAPPRLWQPQSNRTSLGQGRAREGRLRLCCARRGRDGSLAHRVKARFACRVARLAWEPSRSPDVGDHGPLPRLPARSF